MNLPSKVEHATESAWYHLHPAMLWFEAGRILRRLLVPLIIGGVAVSRREGGMGAFFIVTGVISTFGFVSSFLSFRYRLTDYGIEVRQGIFTRRQRSIAIERISHINTHQNALARLWGVERVDIETEGGGAPEASFAALSLTAAEEIRRHVGPVGPAHEGEHTVYVASLRDSVLIGATSLQVGGVVAMVLVGWRFVRRLGGKKAESGLFTEYLARLTAFFDESLISISASPGLIFLSIVLLIAGVWGFGIILSMVRWYGFRVTEQDDQLQVQRGMLSRSRTVIARDRTQAVEIRASFVRNLLGLVQISIVAAGSRGRDRARARVFIPITSIERAGDYLSTLWPQTGEDVKWQSVHPYYRRRHINRGLLALFASMLAAFIVIPLNALTGIAITVAAAVSGYVVWRTASPDFARTGFAISDGYLHVRTGAVSPRRWIVAVARIQSVILQQGLFYRRQDLMDVVIDVNGLTSNQRIAIPAVPRLEAETIQRELTHHV